MASLSNSILWQRMHEYYAQLGTEVWEEEVVPQQITNNTYLANVYAKLIVAQIQDYIAAYGQPSDDSPFYVLEIGAGHGRLSFYLLENLRQAFETFEWPKKWLKFILTDISLKSLEVWQTHHALKPFIDDKWLDVAMFSASTDTEITLAISGQQIKPNTINKPLFVICNYIFDTLAQDAFQVINHQLHEVELVIKNEAQLDKGELKDYFKDAKYEFVRHPVTINYYENPILNKILQAYETECENAAFLIPIGAFQCIEKLKGFTKGPLIFLASDKGVTDKELFDEGEDPDISFHGSVSMMVNFDALRRYTELCGGSCSLMGDKGADFQVANFIFQADYKTPQTAYTFLNSLSSFSPQDLFDICYVDDEPITNFKSLESMVNILNLAEWDPVIVYDYHEQLIEKLENNDDLTVGVQQSILNGLERAGRYFFKLEKSQDLPFAIGSILYNMDFNERAIEFYHRSIALFGKDKDTYFNLTLAYQALGNYAKAQEMINQSLKIAPKDEAIAELQSEMEAA